MKWYNLKGELIENHVHYISVFVEKHPETEIYVSTDSQNKGVKTKYVSVIVLYQKGKGGHVIFSKRFLKRKIFGKESGRDFQKLYNEILYSKEIADELLIGLGKKVFAIDLDYNKDDRFFSNKLLAVSTGMLFDSAETVRSKPNALACYAADKLVKSEQYG